MGLAGVLSAAGCAPDDTADRLRALEARVEALEAKPAPVAPAAPAGATLADVQSLENRLAALEQRVAAGAPSGVAAGVDGSPERRLEVRRERRARLRDVTEQYRAKLAAIRQEHPDPAARQQAVREALQWYRDQRRAVLAGDQPTSQTPDAP